MQFNNDKTPHASGCPPFDPNCYVVRLRAALVPSEARAESQRDDPRLMLGADFEYALYPFDDFLLNSMGGALRVGLPISLPLIEITPELRFGYHNVETNEDDRAYTVTGQAGVRMRFFKVISPGVFAHIGIGHLGSWRSPKTSEAWDVGVLLDFTMLPALDFGVHAAVVTLGVIQVTMGAHIEFAL